jgi:hypothetical protein
MLGQKKKSYFAITWQAIFNRVLLFKEYDAKQFVDIYVQRALCDAIDSHEPAKTAASDFWHQAER